MLEVHHIVNQSAFKDNKCKANNKEHIKKNQLSNLVVLCAYHHDLVHSNKITISGWKDTTKGIKLDYQVL